VPCVAAVIAAFVGIGAGLIADEDACRDALGHYYGREGSGLSSSGPLVYETCTLYLPSGRVVEAGVTHWWSVAFAIPMSIGAWFTFAGLLRLIRPRVAITALAGSLAAFLAVCVIFFA
jgi:hypothetical protein